MGALSSTTTTLAERIVDAIERRDADAYAALHAQDAVGAYHPLSPEPLRGRDAIHAAEQELFEQFSGIRLDVRSVLGGDDGLALRLVLSATHAGGRTIELPAVWWYDLDGDGLIAEARVCFDTAVLNAQLGE
jgi:ketosteroid isomerase-like protein